MTLGELSIISVVSVAIVCVVIRNWNESEKI